MPAGVAIGAGVGALVGTGVAAGMTGATTMTIFCGALYGASLGSSLGALIDPPTSPKDKSAAYETAIDRNTIATGIPIPVIYGKNKIFGNVFRQEIDADNHNSLNTYIGLGEGVINKACEVRVNNKLLCDLEETLQVKVYKIRAGNVGIDFKESDGAYGRSKDYWKGATITIQGGVNNGKVRQCFASASWDTRETGVVIRMMVSDLLYDESDVGCFISRFQNHFFLGDMGEYKNLAYIYIEISPTSYVRSTLQEVSSIVEGLKVYIPAGWPDTEDIDRFAYTNNPAWCIYDFLSVDRPDGVGVPKVNYGAGIPRSWLDLNSFKAAATYYAEIMADDGGPRFECNYIIDSRKSGMDHLLVMLGACNSFLVHKEGKFYLKPQKGDDPVVQVFNNDNHRDLKYYPEGTERRVNQIKAKFTEAPYEYHAGTALGRSANTITLATTASATDDEYNGMVIEILSGAGVGQVKDIIDYNGSTKVATVESNWRTLPYLDSVYQIRKGNFEIIQAVIDDPIAQSEDGETIPREIDLLPCNRFSQAGRLAQMHLDGIRLGNGVCQFVAGLNSVHCNPGDVIEINSSRMIWGSGCTQQAACGNAACPGTYVACIETYAATAYYAGDGLLFRILQIRERQEHREMEITAKREHPGIYHDYCSGKQESTALAARNPLYAPDPVTDLALEDAGEREPDGKWRKAMTVTFIPPLDHFYKEAIISISYDGGYSYEEIARTADFICKIFPKKEAVRAGIADSGTTVRLEHDALTDRADNFYIGAILTITAGTNSGQSRTITASGEGYVEWEMPMLASIDGTSEYTITEYFILVQSVNKFDVVSLSLDSPTASIIVQSPVIHLPNDSQFEELNGLKNLVTIAEFFHYAITSGAYVGKRPSIFVDLDGSNSGLYIAHVRMDISPISKNIYINDTLIYSGGTDNSWLAPSLHSLRDGKAYLCFTNSSHDLMINEIDVTTTPWTIASPLQISLTGDFYFPQIQMIDSTHFFCVAVKYNSTTTKFDVILFKGDTSGNVIGSVVTIWAGTYNEDGWYVDLIWDGTNIYVCFAAGSFQEYQIYFQKLTATPSLIGSPKSLFSMVVGDETTGNLPHIEKIDNRLYLIFAQITEEGFDSTIFMAETDLDGSVIVDPHPVYLLKEEVGMYGDSCNGLDFFVGQIDVANPEIIHVAWLQYQSDGSQNYQYFYRHKLKKIVLLNKDFNKLYNNLL